MLQIIGMVAAAAFPGVALLLLAWTPFSAWSLLYQALIIVLHILLYNLNTNNYRDLYFKHGVIAVIYALILALHLLSALLAFLLPSPPRLLPALSPSPLEHLLWALLALWLLYLHSMRSKYWRIISLQELHCERELSVDQILKIKWFYKQTSELNPLFSALLNRAAALLTRLFYLAVVFFSLIHSYSISMLVYLIAMVVFYLRVNKVKLQRLTSSKIQDRLSVELAQWQKSFLSKELSAKVRSHRQLILELDQVAYDYFMFRYQLQKSSRDIIYYLSLLFLTINLLLPLLSFLDFPQKQLLQWALYLLGPYAPHNTLTQIYPYACAIVVCQFDMWGYERLRSQFGPIVKKQPVYQIIVKTNEIRGLYYKNKLRNLIKNIQKSLPCLMERAYLAFFLLLSEVKTSVFGLIALIVVFFVFFLDGKSGLKVMSWFSGVIIILQYLVLILSLGPTSSPRQFPAEFREYDLLEMIIREEFWRNLIALGRMQTEKIGFVINILVLVSFQLYFQWLLVLYRNMLNRLQLSVEQLRSELLKRDLELSETKHQERSRIYAIAKQIYKSLVFKTPVLLTLLSIILLVQSYSLTNLGLALLSFLCLFLSSFTSSWFQQKEWLLRALFTASRGFSLGLIAVYGMVKLPYLDDKICTWLICSKAQLSTSIVKIILFLLFQLGIDLLHSQQFKRTALKEQGKHQHNSLLVGTALLYSQHQALVTKALHQHQKLQLVKKDCAQILNSFQKLQIPSFQYTVQQQMGYLDALRNWLPNFINPFLFNKDKAFALLAHSNRQVFNLTHMQLGKIQADKQLRQQFVAALVNYYEVLYERLALLEDSLTLQNVQDLIADIKTTQLWIRSCQELQQAQSMRLSITAINLQRLKQQSQKLQFQLFSLPLLMYQAVVSNWHQLCICSVILYSVLNEGIVSMLLPLLLFCIFLPESSVPSLQFWQCCFLYSFCVIITKVLLTNQVIDFPDQLILALFGRASKGLFLQFTLILLTFIQVSLLRDLGQFSSRAIMKPQMVVMRMVCSGQSQAVKFLKEECKGQGQDLLSLQLAVQLLLTIYLFIFYERMTANELSLTQMIQFNRFSVGLILSLIFQASLMILQRFIHTRTGLDSALRTTQLRLKRSLHLLVVLIIHIGVFMSMSGGYFLNRKHQSGNFYIKLFYLIYCGYLWASAIQIRQGYKSVDLLSDFGTINRYVYMIFRSLPFLFQFRCFSDWFMSSTALRMFDWIKLQDIFGRLFLAKCDSVWLSSKRMGQRIQSWKKLLQGFGMLVTIWLLIFGPMVLFSKVNPLAQQNSVESVWVQLQLSVNNSNFYSIFKNSHVTDIHRPQQQQFKKNRMEWVTGLGLDHTDFQVVKLSSSSDEYWEISEPAKNSLLAELDSVLLKESKTKFYMVLLTRFTRKFTQSTSLLKISQQLLDQSQLLSLKNTVLNCNSSLQFRGLLKSTLRVDNTNKIQELGGEGGAVQGRMICGSKGVFWEMMTDGQPLTFWVSSDKYTSYISGYSVTSFYISIILLIANYLRALFVGGAERIVLADIPKSDSLLRIYEGILVARLEQKLQEQERLYWWIMDLLRNPDSLQSVTGKWLGQRLQTLERRQAKYEEE